MHMVRSVPSVSLVVAVATLAAAAPTATVQLLRVAATVWKLNAGSTGEFSKDVLETAWLWPLSIAENGTGLHRTARRTRPSTHRLAAAVDAADARVALPCHIALDQHPVHEGVFGIHIRCLGWTVAKEVCEKTLMGHWGGHDAS